MSTQIYEYISKWEEESHIVEAEELKYEQYCDEERDMEGEIERMIEIAQEDDF